MKIAKTSVCAFAVVLVSGQQARAQASVMTSLNPTGRQMGQIPAGPPAKRIKGCENAPAGAKNIHCWYMAFDEKTGKYKREAEHISSSSIQEMVSREPAGIIDSEITKAVNDAINSSYISSNSAPPSADPRNIRDKTIDFQKTAISIVQETRFLDSPASSAEINALVSTQNSRNSQLFRSKADHAAGTPHTGQEDGARGAPPVNPKSTLKTCRTTRDPNPHPC